ncbi:uncharacterized protein BCR38DRAFT_510073 [Pseudomassariella vexata]|uniref:Uncharacterized protein n=1 Tax=Pseudomassariella vexata TaxID=1141098 RepID=A0A1Y2E723_9PEZI|nr:uncharacterized protein BCR38DRAFT_510073 [Pseudomassariella vexata]ORY67329.1 hypothetical protein BCR38DRAFT_510073 [Pseudomassariella vexata]
MYSLRTATKVYSNFELTASLLLGLISTLKEQKRRELEDCQNSSTSSACSRAVSLVGYVSVRDYRAIDCTDWSAESLPSKKLHSTSEELAMFPTTMSTFRTGITATVTMTNNVPTTLEMISVAPSTGTITKPVTITATPSSDAPTTVEAVTTASTTDTSHLSVTDTAAPSTYASNALETATTAPATHITAKSRTGTVDPSAHTHAISKVKANDPSTHSTSLTTPILPSTTNPLLQLLQLLQLPITIHPHHSPPPSENSEPY